MDRPRDMKNHLRASRRKHLSGTFNVAAALVVSLGEKKRNVNGMMSEHAKAVLRSATNKGRFNWNHTKNWKIGRIPEKNSQNYGGNSFDALRISSIPRFIAFSECDDV